MKVFRLALLVLVAACASQEILEPRSAVAPEFIDFSGNWQLRRDSAADRERINRAISKAAGDNADIIPIPPEAGRSGQGSRRTPPRQGGGLVQVFLESGENLKITQTAHGIFISFDRSVVEEYRFGENRTINVGEIEAQRVSGWDGDRYVVETLDRKGMKLTEQFYLSEDGQTLHRLIVLRNRDNTDVTMRQSFSRED
ncbi:MAG: hypothetical protein RLN69_07875 [Woeseiaceae bacterium]